MAVRLAGWHPRLRTWPGPAATNASPLPPGYGGQEHTMLRRTITQSGPQGAPGILTDISPLPPHPLPRLSCCPALPACPCRPARGHAASQTPLEARTVTRQETRPGHVLPFSLPLPSRSVCQHAQAFPLPIPAVIVGPPVETRSEGRGMLIIVQQ